MAYHKGDDLEDDFMPDETVALSEDEGFGSLVGDQDDIGKLLSADEEDVESPVERTKAPLDEKKRKRREKEKERKAKECPLAPSSQGILVFLTRDYFYNRRENLTKLRNQGISLQWRCGRLV
jgi:protein CMS1